MNNPTADTTEAALREPIPGYVLLERIGVGGCGEVWKANAPGGMLKAVKLVFGNADETRAVNERKSLNRMKDIRHPFLLSIERIEEINGHLCIVTELAESSLQDRLKHCQDLGMAGIPRNELLEYLRDTADALDFLYERYSFQHLDVKPENLLLVANRVKVADFGLVTDVRTTSESLAGGLTPLYAAPEVFDGRPTPTSDQYSLAIVFQQLLTGHPPFNGRTAAQLAAQHLQIKPLLTHLPPHDRPVVARALSKNPALRFASCRELVQALITAASTPLSVPSFISPSEETISKPSASEGVLPSASSLDLETEEFQQATADDNITPTAKVMENVSQTISLGENYLREISSQRTQQGEITNLPPLPESTEPTHFQPTLVIGLGGAAGRVLTQYRRRLLDRYENLDAIKSWQTILIDTDSAAIRSTVQDKTNVGLKDRDVLAIPLRKPEEYRSDSSKHLRWMSRRWLYNIPRSLQTEGIRPLGRLAFVDHYERIRIRLQDALHLMIDQESLVESEQAAKRHFFPVTPRVVIVAATSGGTGGGMVLDVAAAVRLILQEMGFPDAPVMGMFLHATERRVGTHGLAIANSYATLSELHHMNQSPQGYPGDPACKLPKFSGKQKLFSQQYAIHLGDDLNDNEFASAIDSVAEYIYLDTATPVGGFLQRCRQNRPQQPSAEAPSASDNIRTFAVKQLGGSNSQIPHTVAEMLSLHLLQTWRGTAIARQDTPVVDLVDVNSLLAAHGAAKETPTGDTERLVQEKMESLNLEQLVSGAYDTLKKEVGGDLDAFLTHVLRQTKPPEIKHKPLPPASKILETIDAIIGAQANEEESLAAGPPSLATILATRLTEQAKTQGEKLQAWSLEYADLNPLRIKGAQKFIDGCLEHLRELEKSLTELAQQYRTHLSELRQLLCHQELTEAAGRDPSGLPPRNVKNKPLTDANWMEYIRTRLHIVTLRTACLELRILQGKLTSASDSLRDLWKDLHQIEREFSAKPMGATEHDMLADMLWKNRDQLIAEIDEELSSVLSSKDHRIRHLVSVGQDLRARLVMQLRTAARRVTLGAMKAINTRAACAQESSAEADDSLEHELSHLQPRLLESGGAQRLVVVLPEGSDAAEVQASLGPNGQPNILFDTDGDIVLCREGEQISLSQAARLMVKGHPQSLKAASQLHTRTDVSWIDFS